MGHSLHDRKRGDTLVVDLCFLALVAIVVGAGIVEVLRWAFP